MVCALCEATNDLNYNVHYIIIGEKLLIMYMFLCMSLFFNEKMLSIKIWLLKVIYFLYNEIYFNQILNVLKERFKYGAVVVSAEVA